MDHDYEISSYDRTTAHIYDLEKLSKPQSYWQKIAPTRAEDERVAREQKEAAKAQAKQARE
jgi:NADH-quinone oxidoreductase subunit I